MTVECTGGDGKLFSALGGDITADITCCLQQGGHECAATRMMRLAETKDKVMADASVVCRRRDGWRRKVTETSLSKVRSKGGGVKTAA